MARYPKAIWKPVTAKKRLRMLRYDRFNLHVAVSETSSLHSFFNRNGNPDSHFYVRKDGTVEQYVDTSMRAYCDVEGNSTTISVETQGGLKNDQGEPWTDEQMIALAELWAWVRKTHGVKQKIAVDSRPNKNSSRGLSYHRLGIDPWRVSGGLRYSNSRGKICPGDAKIAQVPEIHKLSQPKQKPKPKPEQKKFNLQEDGYWGPATTRALQQVYGTTVDGVLSSQVKHSGNKNVPSADFVPSAKRGTGSQLIRAIQKALKVKTVNGQLNKTTIRAMQRKLGTTQDGLISSPSDVVRAMQRALNAGKKPF